MFAYVGSIQDLKDLKDLGAHLAALMRDGDTGFCLYIIQGYLTYKKTPPPKTLLWAFA